MWVSGANGGGGVAKFFFGRCARALALSQHDDGCALKLREKLRIMWLVVYITHTPKRQKC